MDAAAVKAPDPIARMTSGQRWTASIVAAIAAAILAFGLPTRVVTEVARASAAPTTVPPVTVSPPATPPVVAATLLTPPTVPSPTVPASRPPATVTTIPTTTMPAGAVAPLPITALVVGADDAALAAAFLPTAARTDIGVGSEAVCEALGDDPGVVVARLTIAPALRDCLLAAGAIVIAHDPLGSGAFGDGVLVSSAASTDVTARATAAWIAGGTPELPEPVAGPVGLVVGDGVTDPNAFAEAFAGAGVEVGDTAVLASTADVPAAVLRFRLAGVRTVVFAVDPVLRADWVTLDQGDSAYVVTDLALGTFGDSDPAAFDGAVALTALRPPWQVPGGDNETSAQARCRHRAAAAGDDVDPTAVAAWCTHAALAIDAAAAGERHAVLDALPPLDAALTAPLGGTVPYGPSARFVVRWSSSCSCWGG